MNDLLIYFQISYESLLVLIMTSITCAIIKPTKEEPLTSASVRLISEILKVKFA